MFWSPTSVFNNLYLCALFFSSDSLGQVVLTQSGDQTVQPDQTVTITCKHKPEVNCVNNQEEKKSCMSWYHQIPGEAPKLLTYFTDKRASGVSSRFSGSERLNFQLTISGVQPEDTHREKEGSLQPFW
uniref:Immunoglobulin V-set domain-containing protein n=1 Tax=Pygocentrus nattereri TaxID=42514 RepID=A0AAR2JX16_PYGNA